MENRITPDTTESSLSQKIVKNTAYNAVGWFLGILVTVFLTPYIIRRIGLERFGLWAITGVVTGYFALLDFGFGMSFVKHIAEFYTKREPNKINQLVNTGVVFYSLLTIIIFSASAVFIKPIVGVFKIPPYLYNEAAFVLLTGIFVFFSSNALAPFGAIQTGLQRMDIQNIVYIAVLSMNVLGSVFFLENGYGLPGLMINNVIILILTGIANIIIAHRLLPGLRFNPVMHKEMFDKLFKFGFKVQVAKIGGVITGQTNKLLIAYFLSIGLVTFYHLGSSVVYYAVTISVLFVSALIPAFSEIEARGETKRLAEAYLMTTRYLSFFVAPFFVFLIISASDIMSLWMGQGYEKSALIIQILAASYALNTIAQVAFAACMAVGKPQLLTAGTVIMLVLNLALSAIFIKMFGFAGSALGNLFAINIGTIYFLAMLDKALRISHIEVVKKIIPYFFIAAISSGIIVLMGLPMNNFHQPASRAMLLVFLFAKGLVFGGLYIALAYATRLVDLEDVAFWRQKFRFVRQRI